MSKNDKVLYNYRESLILQEKSQTTINKYIRDADRFLDFISKEISGIKKQDILRYKEHLSKRYKPVSVNSYLISINRFLSYLNKNSFRVKTIRIQRESSLNNMFSDEEYSQLVKTAKEHDKIRIYYMIRVLASSGIRIGELQYLTKDTLKSGGTFVRGKTKIREILIPNSLCLELLEYCESEQITGVIFHGRKKDKLIDKARIWRELKELAELAGIPVDKVHAHNFRHYFAKKYLSTYHDLVDLADILGHNSIETTRIYTRTSGQEKRSRINGLGL